MMKSTVPLQSFMTARQSATKPEEAATQHPETDQSEAMILKGASDGVLDASRTWRAITTLQTAAQMHQSDTSPVARSTERTDSAATLATPKMKRRR
jgi:hypothetical protein